MIGHVITFIIIVLIVALCFYLYFLNLNNAF